MTFFAAKFRVSVETRDQSIISKHYSASAAVASSCSGSETGKHENIHRMRITGQGVQDRDYKTGM